MVPPPTLCFDWYLLGWPASLIAFLFVAGSLIAACYFLFRRGSPGRNLVVLLGCLGLFFLIDCGIYITAIQVGSPGRPQRILPDDPTVKKKYEPASKPEE